jgi:CobQ-like glutamine amidotransferase family enzyme
MSQIIRLFPSRLNLNGDQANALVLQKRAQWAGVEIDVVDYEDVTTLTPLMKILEDSDASTMLILGHGSLAAMSSIAHLKADLQQLLAYAKQRGQTVLIVGSSTEWLLEHSVGERESNFWQGSISYEGENFDVNGYLNSRAQLAPVHVDASLIYVLLHGPLLAKSEKLADHLVAKLTGRQVQFERREQLAGFVEESVKTAQG